MRNAMIYRATYNTRSNQLASSLSKDLQKRYGKRSVRIVEGDHVIVKRGEYKDVDGKVSKVSILNNSIAIEGIKKEKSKGDKIDVWIHPSNVIVTSLDTEDDWRISRLEGKNPKTNKEIKTSRGKTDEASWVLDDTYDSTKEIESIDADIAALDESDSQVDTSVEEPREIESIDADIAALDEPDTQVDTKVTDYRDTKDSDIKYIDETDDINDTDSIDDTDDTNTTSEINDTKLDNIENTQDVQGVQNTQDADSRSVEK